MNPLLDPEDKDEATRVINQYASNDRCRISYTVHGGARAGERAVDNALVVATLKYGNVVRIDVSECPFSGNPRYAYRVELRDQEGRVTVVTAVPGRLHLKIVTTFADDEE